MWTRKMDCRMHESCRSIDTKTIAVCFWHLSYPPENGTDGKRFAWMADCLPFGKAGQASE